MNSNNQSPKYPGEFGSYSTWTNRNTQHPTTPTTTPALGTNPTQQSSSPPTYNPSVPTFQPRNDVATQYSDSMNAIVGHLVKDPIFRRYVEGLASGVFDEKAKGLLTSQSNNPTGTPPPCLGTLVQTTTLPPVVRGSDCGDKVMSYCVLAHRCWTYKNRADIPSIIRKLKQLGGCKYEFRFTPAGTYDNCTLYWFEVYCSDDDTSRELSMTVTIEKWLSLRKYKLFMTGHDDNESDDSDDSDDSSSDDDTPPPPKNKKHRKPKKQTNDSGSDHKPHRKSH